MDRVVSFGRQRVWLDPQKILQCQEVYPGSRVVLNDLRSSEERLFINLLSFIDVRCPSALVRDPLSNV